LNSLNYKIELLRFDLLLATFVVAIN